MPIIRDNVERVYPPPVAHLEDIGFYTLSDKRASGQHDNLERCEMILTERCNFKCPYCRGLENYSRDCSGHMDYTTAKYILEYWIERKLTSVRLSGGEPTLYPRLPELVDLARKGGIENIAVSTNGSMSYDLYQQLVDFGVNDFSISLDACCAEDADKMAGRAGYFDVVTSNIKRLSEKVYVTVGMVFTDERANAVVDMVQFADSLGVNDIRIISAAQYNGSLQKLENIPAELLAKYPILRYRVNNLLHGRNVRGLEKSRTTKCYLVLDDYAVAGKWHFPCVIHMREGGEPIGTIGDTMQEDREKWFAKHSTHEDIVCEKNCLDCLVDYNNRAEEMRNGINL